MTNVIDIAKLQTKSSYGEWLEKHEQKIIKRLPYGTIVPAPTQVAISGGQNKYLQHDHIASLYTLFPQNLIPDTKICIESDSRKPIIQIHQETDCFAISIWQSNRAKRWPSDLVQHVEYALMLVRAIAETIVVDTYHSNREFGYANMATGFFGEDELPTTGQQLLERFAEIASETSAVSSRAEHFREMYGTDSAIAVIKEAAEVLAIYVTGIAYNGANKPMAADPLMRHGSIRTWCEDFLGMCSCAPSKHE